MTEHRQTQRIGDQAGQVVVIMALLIPLVIVLAAIVVDLGNFFEHRRHLQTQVDAAALAAGSEFAFPCGPNTDTDIEAAARKYVGAHTTAGGTVVTANTYNSQIGTTSPNDIHVVLNGGYWTDSSSPADFSGDLPDIAAGSACADKQIQVNATEDNVDSFFGVWAPDLRATARVQIQEVAGLKGLLPIAVRVPKPRSAATIFYNETTGNILNVTPLTEGTVPSLPAGLGGWSTPNNSGGNGAAASFTMPAGPVGVVIALSFVPAGCPGSAALACFDASYVGGPINNLCRQGGGLTVQCFYGTGTGVTQNVLSGLIFIRSYTPSTPAGNAAPALNSVWVSPDGCPYGSFNVVAVSCRVAVNANVALGTAPDRVPANAQVAVTGGSCNNFSSCVMTESAGTWSTAAGSGADITELSNGNQFAIRIRLKSPAKGTDGVTDCPNNFNGNNFPAICEFIFAAPQQRTFMGGDDASGPIKYLRLTEVDPNGVPVATDTAVSQQFNASPSFVVEMGLSGAIAQDQTEPPLTFNLKGSQSATLDCDPNIPNVKDEVQLGCDVFYAVNKFDTSPNCPGSSQFFTVPKAAPFDNWPPYRCVLTQTGNPTQLLSGFNLRVFGVQNNPTCDADAVSFVKGRNYWADGTNPLSGGNYSFTLLDLSGNVVHGNNLRSDDPRLVNLFMTGYDTFTNSGNETFPIVTFGSFYVTGWGTGTGFGGINIDDPCPGSTPPADLVTEPGGAYVWGHFINNVTPSPNTGGNGVVCDPTVSFQPCVPVLIR